ncbi:MULTISPECIES: carboxymuconolactone decarboxylase family protein [unclassified Mycoplasma]|uniref:carboxymuconolactone decarboxylase family protein n=1 Tax=unclassified Mycoplasma TaxID=2683645 RepID=UPI00216AE553|nr:MULTISPECIES: carboxymuconolactone decarboxylase family protein [unclassified Mycoplasma]MCS4536842.1 carboxymuconolactone decarboxylase family protein [Mycoplasma sp. CSL7475-4]MCT4469681.1 carboxymuconolactone decarboxylase family protein [Mycoplasma sp. HS2188]
MTKRVVIAKQDPESTKILSQLNAHISANLSPILIELIKVRASQINKCAYCLEIHTKAALEAGETERRIFALPAWTESPLFSEKEKAVLKMTEEITHISNVALSDETFEELSKFFNEAEISDLMMNAIAINTWNRIALVSKVKHKN